MRVPFSSSLFGQVDVHIPHEPKDQLVSKSTECPFTFRRYLKHIRDVEWEIPADVSEV
jgi:hypothetical protein